MGIQLTMCVRCYEPTLPENVILYDKGRLTRQKKILSAKGFQAVLKKEEEVDIHLKNVGLYVVILKIVCFSKDSLCRIAPVPQSGELHMVA